MLRLATLLCSIFSLQANWNPHSLTIPKEELALLESPHIQQFEKHVLNCIQNSWCSQEKGKLLFELVFLTKPQTIVDIGAFIGSCSIPMLAALQKRGSGCGYIVDAWSTQETLKNLPPNDPYTAWWAGIDMNAAKEQCISVLNGWSFQPFCKIIDKPSLYAALEIEEIDILHLDGNFSEEGALQDTLVYLPKVKPGGYILLSNVFMMINNQATKSKALFPIFDSCELVSELENGGALLFRKKD